jgi:hypothetical protein
MSRSNRILSQFEHKRVHSKISINLRQGGENSIVRGIIISLLDQKIQHHIANDHRIYLKTKSSKATRANLFKKHEQLFALWLSEANF